jgi:hypothetical protein
MMPREQLYPVVSSTAVLWHESGENPVIFCYLIGWDAFTRLRSLVLTLFPYPARHESACLKPSFTSSAPSTAQRGSEN